MKNIQHNPIKIKKFAEQIALILQQTYPEPKTELNFKNEYQLAVAVMLSAQTTDKKVNQVTPNLFAHYKNWAELALAPPTDIVPLIRAVNFHKGKAERLVKAGQVVTSLFAGQLPRTISDLIKIPGVARKTANVILQELWDIAEGIVVDTHITRVSNRLGLTTNTDPKKIEQDLMRILPQKYWRNYSGAAVLHGRYICVARKPKCGECVLSKVCPSAFKI